MLILCACALQAILYGACPRVVAIPESMGARSLSISSTSSNRLTFSLRADALLFLLRQTRIAYILGNPPVLVATDTDSWRTVETSQANVPMGRFGHTSVADENGTLYIYGGYYGPVLGDLWSFRAGVCVCVRLWCRSLKGWGFGPAVLVAVQNLSLPIRSARSELLFLTRPLDRRVQGQDLTHPVRA